ncbi:MAG: (2Fe-2S)-binding protein, partial [Planctomycetota bacterium]
AQHIEADLDFALEVGVDYVILDGRAVMSCMTLAHEAAGRSIWTVEGVASESPRGIHPIQAAWAECGGSQCGFCTAGFIMTSLAFLGEERQPSRKRIAEAISGNVCRCTGYKKILDAIELAAGRMARAAEQEILFP